MSPFSHVIHPNFSLAHHLRQFQCEFDKNINEDPRVLHISNCELLPLPFDLGYDALQRSKLKRIP
jgi:hypothetical protein